MLQQQHNLHHGASTELCGVCMGCTCLELCNQLPLLEAATHCTDIQLRHGTSYPMRLHHITIIGEASSASLYELAWSNQHPCLPVRQQRCWPVWQWASPEHQHRCLRACKERPDGVEPPVCIPELLQIGGVVQTAHVQGDTYLQLPGELCALVYPNQGPTSGELIYQPPGLQSPGPRNLVPSQRLYGQ
jgi:hypothetical protein